MPKVFLTGSGVTRGYVTGSGFISLPPRVLIKQYDSATGSYPTILRTGDVTRKGNYSVRFDDTYSVPFESPFATAEIDFGFVLEDNSNTIFPSDGDTITLSDANGNTEIFTFVNSLRSFDSSPDNPVVFTDAFDRNLLARNFTKAINSSSLKISAKVKATRKTLRSNATANSAGGPLGGALTFSSDNVIISLKQLIPGSAGNASISRSVTSFLQRSQIERSERGIDVLVRKHYGLKIPANFTGGKQLSVNRTTNLPAGAQRLQRQAYASPNILETQLDGNGVIVKGVADAHIKFTPGEDLGPFTDSRINLGDSLFYAEGTPESVYPGFSSKLGSKTQLSIDITPSSIGRIYKMGRDLVPSVITDPITLKEQNSGFMYYNFTNRKWERAGNFNTSSLSQDNVYYNLRRNNSLTTLQFVSGTDRFPMQFTPPMHMASSAGKIIRDIANAGSSSDYIDSAYVEMGYSNIGKPTMSSFAPASSRYYATNDQTLKMSDFITSPFLLEKATIELPVVVRRIQSGSFNNLPGMTIGNKYNYFTGSFYRDMDNYVFFLYRQTKDHNNPGKTKRYLIASGSACFYNSTSFFGSTGSNITPYHNPSFKHDFNTQTPLSSGVGIGPFIGEFSFTGSIKIELTSGIQSKGYLGGNYFSAIGEPPPGGTLVNRFVQFQHYWPGGTNTDGFQIAGASGLDSNTSSNINLTAATDGAGTLNKTNATIFTYDELRRQADLGLGSGEIERLITLKNDSRDIVSSFGKDSDTTIFQTIVASSSPSSSPLPGTLNTILARSDVASSTISPYLLFPGDELILGVDAGISYCPDDLDGTSGTLFERLRVITGSAMVIESNKESRLTFYGSQIKENKEFHDTLNQPLTSKAVHESIHHTNPVLDQFEVESSTEYVGTYQDDFFPGKNTNTNPITRLGLHITSSVSQSLEVGDSYAFQRNVTLYNRNLTYFDSYLPDIESNIKSLGGVSYTSQSYNFEVTADTTTPITSYIASRNVPGTAAIIAGRLGRYIFEDSLFTNPSSATFTIEPQSINSPLTFARNTKYKGVRGFSEFAKSFLMTPYYYDNKRQISNTRNFEIVAAQVTSVNATQLGSGTPDSNTIYAIGSGSMPRLKIINKAQLISLMGGTVRDFTDTVYNDGISFFNSSSYDNVLSLIELGAGSGTVKIYTASFSRRDLGFPESNALPYGMINVTPTNQRYVFRGSKYGQYADLIYSPPETKFFNSSAPISNARNSGTVMKGIQSAAVNVTFVSGSRNTSLTIRNFKRVSPESQIISEPYFQSSNISTECTSSLPFYDDDVPRNRTYPSTFVDVV